jgi:hypothetical protein
MPVIPIYGGDVFDLGDRMIEVVEAGGHTPGSIILIDPKTRIAYTGDACNGNTLLEFDDSLPVIEYMGSLLRLRKRRPEFDMMYGTGISRTGEVLDIATDLDIIKKGGSWFSYKDQKLGQGRDNVKEILAGDPELMKEIEEQILARKDEIMESASSKKADKKSKAADAAAEAASGGESAAPSDNSDILANIDEDFEEFTPAEE